MQSIINRDYSDYIGRRFHRLTIVDIIHRKRPYCVCNCECGTRGFVTVLWDVRHGEVKGCGCLLKHPANYHGDTASPEYRAWISMKSRCTNPKNQYWHCYGGRGIRVCERWSNYLNFLKDVGRRPSSRHSLDRINTNGNYEPENVRWATPLEQAQNMRKTVFISYEGQTRCLRDWARIFKMSHATIIHKMRQGFSFGAIVQNRQRAIEQKSSGYCESDLREEEGRCQNQ